MQLWQYALLGIVQGLTEFLPISSKSHLLLTERLLGVNPPGVVFEVALHVGTLLSVLLVYRRELLGILRERNWRYIGLIAISAAISAGLILAFDKPLEALMDSPDVVLYIAIGMVFTALWMWLADWRLRHPLPRRPIDVISAVMIGLAQTVAILPGISRSGATIGAALQTGEEREHAARFSFLLSIPMILGAALIKAKDMGDTVASGAISPAGMALGFVCSLLAGVAAIYLVLWMLRKARLVYFAAYCLLVSAGCFAYYFVHA